MKLKFIDIHSHVNFSAFESDREEVVARAAENGVSFIGIGTDHNTSKQVVQMAEQYPHVYAIIGLHPVYVNKSREGDLDTPGEDFNYESYLELAKHPRVVGIGECGLDFYHTTEDTNEFKARQQTAFEAQLKLALEVNKPVMIHCRDAYTSTLRTLKQFQEKSGGKLRGNFHFFAGTLQNAKDILDLGFTMSFTGVITFAPQFRELVEFVPLDKMHAETDSPYVAPVPFRGKRNEPLYVIEVVKKIAEIKKLPIKEVADQLILNAEALFGVKV